LILDIDGVLTNGTKMYDLEGNVFGKSFYDHDFTAIKLFNKTGVSVCFLSGDRRVNQKMADNRGINFFHNTKGTNKSDYLERICTTYGVTDQETAYVGDDIYDLDIMKMVKYPMCPEDAVWEVFDFCQDNGYIIPCESGKGVIKRLYFEMQALWKK